IEAVPAEAFLRSRLKALVILRVVLPFDFGRVLAQAEIGGFAAGAGKSVEGDDPGRLDRALYALVPGTADALLCLGQQPEQSLVLFLAIMQSGSACFGIGLFTFQVQNVANVLK